MYVIFTNRAYILDYLQKKNRLDKVFCEEGSYAEKYCKNKNIFYKKYINKKDSFKFLNQSLNKKIILNGYKFIIPKKILVKLNYKLINIHPSLLPAYKGQFIVHKIIKDKPKFIGATVHWVSEQVDSGGILIQVKKKFQVKLSKKNIYKTLFKLELIAFKKFFNSNIF